jgi:hypothetical protein
MSRFKGRDQRRRCCACLSRHAWPVLTAAFHVSLVSSEIDAVTTCDHMYMSEEEMPRSRFKGRDQRRRCCARLSRHAWPVLTAAFHVSLASEIDAVTTCDHMSMSEEEMPRSRFRDQRRRCCARLSRHAWPVLTAAFHVSLASERDAVTTCDHMSMSEEEMPRSRFRDQRRRCCVRLSRHAWPVLTAPFHLSLVSCLRDRCRDQVLCRGRKDRDQTRR